MRNFKLNRVTAAVMMFTAGLALTQHAAAGPGFVTAVGPDGVTTFPLPTYFANSPSGLRVAPVGAADPNTGAALRKFVDPLPLVGAANAKPLSRDASAVKYIPKAVASKWVKPDGVTVSGDDYYEIAVVEYSEKFHSDLAKATTLRGYVQIDHLASNGRPALPGGIAFPLSYPDGTPIMINGTDAGGKLTGSQVQALAVDKPHYLGPLIEAAKDVPTRVKFLNLLPAGRADVTGTGTGNAAVVTARNGDLFLPVDRSILGAGAGPDGVTTYTQNRANIHLHGGDNPWISDGTPHQWITPVEEANAANARSLAHLFANDPALDPTLLPSFLRGASAQNVPDMNDPGPGASTYYFPNGQTARQLWYHDQSAGITRLNNYAGVAALYTITDPAEQALIAAGTLPPSDRTIPLVLQDRSFVPRDIALQDSLWNTSAWGAEGDLWFPHVYEAIEDPAQFHGWNAVGRWYYGPLFWPVFPAQYMLPTGAYGDETITPEAHLDTPVVNGVAYPTLDVEPTTYRFRVLNASNDRHLTFNLFEAKTVATLADGTQIPNTVTDATGAVIASEIDMVQASAPLPAVACPPGQVRPTPIPGSPTGQFCTPDTWPIDSRPGGVPDPKGVGPSMYQIANEGGLLPQAATLEPTPILYNIDKGSITIFNVEGPALVLAPGERADLVIDFSQYAGKTLIVFNDAGAPEPGADPRYHYYTGVGDQSGSGGAEDTKPGYGPNTHTMMQIKVKAASVNTPAATATSAALSTAITSAYLASQDRPLVAQPAYAGFDATWAGISPTQAYASISTGAMKDPTFNFIPGSPGTAFNSIQVLGGGSGYVKAPVVIITPTNGQGSGATAAATLKVSAINVTTPGSGYVTAPPITFNALAGGGTGVTATATLAPDTVTVTAGGSGYTTAPTVNFSAPPPGAVMPLAHAVVSGGAVTQVIVDVAGSGYAAVPSVTFGFVSGATGARASVTAAIDKVNLTAPYPGFPDTIGGVGYTDLSRLAVIFTGGGGTGAAATATGRVFDISLTNTGGGYTTPPNVTVAAPPAGGTTATAQVDRANGGAAQGSLLVQNKAIQELFDTAYGRYNNTLGIELPFANAFNQTTIPLGYVDKLSEEVLNGETQLWKFTHNGLFNQAVHFRGYNVQLVNRVAWDGHVNPPAANELGWKETVRVNPLEDTVVALKPKKAALPGFGLPLSVRPADPTQPLGSPAGFTQIDPATGNPASIVNDMVDYGWEYTIADTILSRNENDFTRPVKFNAAEALPPAPGINLPVPAAAATGTGSDISVTWSDNSNTEYLFLVQRADASPVDPAAPVGAPLVFGPFATVGTALANATSFVDPNVPNPNLSGGDVVAYKVIAVGAAGQSESLVVNTPLPAAIPVAPAGLTAVANSATQVVLKWADKSVNETGFLLERSLDNVAWTPVQPAVLADGSDLPANSVQFTDNGLTTNTLYYYQLSAVNAQGVSTPPATAQVYTLGALPVANLAAVANSPTQVTLSWTPPAQTANTTISSYTIVRTGGAATATFTAASGASGFVDSTAIQHTTYSYAVNTVNNTGLSAVAGPAVLVPVTTPYAAVVLTGLSAVADSMTQVTVRWTGGTPATATLVERCTATAANFNCTLATSVWLPAVVVTTPSPYVDANVVANTMYAYRVTAINGTLADGTTPNVSNTLTTTVTTPSTNLVVSAPTGLTAAVSFTQARITLSWTDTAVNETAFIVQRSTDGVNYSQIGTAAPRTGTPTVAGTAGQTRNYTDAAVSGGQTYFYRVLAENVTGAVTTQSPPTAPVQVDYFLVAPILKTATIARANRITVSWTDTTSAEASFAVWRSANGGPAAQVGTVNRSGAQATATGGAVNFNDNTAFALGTTYTYYVTAVNGAVASLPSNTVSVPFLAPALPAPMVAVVTPIVGSNTRSSVALSWAAAPAGVTYTVQRIAPAALGGGTTNLLTNTTLTSFTDPSVRRNAQPYTYQIRANGAAGSTAYVTTSVAVN
jgi:FtsP/CotA-like multicopper oxidase with cupredoxin domain/fibronectin type 3 domain-containing protein